MKKMLSSLVLLLAGLTLLTAQNITSGSKWFDGHVLYTASVKGNLVIMDGISGAGEPWTFVLEKTYLDGEYTLHDDTPADFLEEYNLDYGLPVNYIRSDGMKFLAFYDDSGYLMQTMTLTPDTLEDCLGQQDFAYDQPVNEMLDAFLFNVSYLRFFEREDLLYMKERLESIEKPDIIASFNTSLVNSWLRFMDTEEDDRPVYLVSTAGEFFDALGNDRIVELAEGFSLNLTPYLRDRSFCTQHGITCVPEGEAYAAKGLVAEEVYDGPQLVLNGFSGLIIRGQRHNELIAEPRYAFVVKFLDCEFSTIKNLTLGHTEDGRCEGGVIGLEQTLGINILDCDLYGCGTYGIQMNNCNGVFVERTVIRDCSYGALLMDDAHSVTFETCDFVRNREYGIVEVHENCEFVLFNNCRFAQNRGFLFSRGMTIGVHYSEIHHLGDLGDDFGVSYVETRFFDDDEFLSSRGIGPDRGELVPMEIASELPIQ